MGWPSPPGTWYQSSPSWRISYMPHPRLASVDCNRTESHQSSLSIDQTGTVNTATNFLPSDVVRLFRRVFRRLFFFLSGVMPLLSRVDFHTRFAALMNCSFSSLSSSATLNSTRVRSVMYSTWGLAGQCVLARATSITYVCTHRYVCPILTFNHHIVRLVRSS
jgi:hypothetical protein